MSIFSKKKIIVLLIGMLFSSAFINAQTVVTGKVLDESNLPISSANIQIKETKGGTFTNESGAFSITVPSGGKTFTVSSVGYQTKEVAINGAVINVILKVLNKDLGEAVVVGYGSRKKGDLTASITTITAKDFQKGNITTPEQLIAGKVAGVSVISNGGAPGSGSTIRIRGGASLNASNDPLIVIDGVAISNNGISGSSNPLSLVNPNDIESFTILKDAASTAIYGSRASNGVILITTKKGKKGTNLNFSTQISLATPAQKADVMSAAEFRNFVQTKGTASQNAQLGTANTDWQNEIYQNAIAIDNNLSLSGTYKKLPYRLSLGYLNQNGILRTDNLSRTSIGVNVNPKFFNDHLKVDVGVKTAFNKSQFANQGAIGNAVSYNPTLPVLSGSTRYGGYSQLLDPTSTTGLRGLAPRNPVALLEQREDIGNTNRIIANVQVDYKFHFLPQLRAVVNVATDRSTGNGTVVVPDSAASNYRTDGLVSGTYAYGLNNKYKQENKNELLESYLAYEQNIKNIKSRFDVMAGTSYQAFETKNYSYDNVGKNNVVISKPNFPFDIQQNRLFSYFGRLNFTVNNKYLLSANARRDYSSRFNPNQRFGDFYGVSFAWKLKEESFLKNVDFVNDLKLRVGYGSVGNQDGLSNYGYLSFYDLSNANSQYQFGNTYYQMYRPGAYDGNRGWEETATQNIGLDFSLVKNRIGGSIDVYKRTTTDLLSPKTQAAGTNFSPEITANIGDMENRGVEVNLNLVPVRNKNTTVDFNFNVTYNENKITKLTEFEDPNFVGFEVGGISGGTGNRIQVHSVGSPRASFYVYKQVYDPATGKPIENLFEDLDRDGSITDKDRYRLYNPDPKWLFGFSPNVNYKKWNAGFVVRAAVGNYIYNNNASSRGTQNSILNPLGFLANGSRKVLESNFVGTGSRFFSSDYFIENASFLRMDNLSLGYNAGKLLKKSNAGFRFNFNVQNVFVSTKYSGMDPEVNGGIDNVIYARPRTFSLGVNVDLNLNK
jgi:TonB-dependent starch-binding outer membrane protein SusC